jgi:hypothetical protein
MCSVMSQLISLQDKDGDVAQPEKGIPQKGKLEALKQIEYKHI